MERKARSQQWKGYRHYKVYKLYSGIMLIIYHFLSIIYHFPQEHLHTRLSWDQQGQEVMLVFSQQLMFRQTIMIPKFNFAFMQLSTQ